MQKGRQYRAAQPRHNLPSFGYSQRWPMRLNIRGEFDYQGVTLNVPASQIRHRCVYDPLLLHWRNVNDFIIGAVPFVGTAQIKYVDAPWQWQLRIGVTDGVGHTLNTWAVDERFFPRFGLGPFPIFPPPTSIETTGFFGPISFLQVQVVPYADE